MVRFETKLEEKSCQWAEPGKPSIVVRTTSGRLGNCLFGYVILLRHKVRFPVLKYVHIFIGISKDFTSMELLYQIPT